jgi:site-specific DNA-adenine methylase
MKNIRELSLSEMTGKIIKCIELVTNDSEEISTEIYVLEDNENQNELCEELNEHNNDKHYKYIAVDYEVQEDGSLASV